MGEIEKKIKRKVFLGKLQSTVLATIGGTGILAAALIAPGLFKFLKYTGIDRKIKHRLFSVNRSVARLVENGFLIYEEKNGKKFLRITARGKTHLDWSIENISRKGKTRKWDGKWRMVIFDIKEYKKDVREKLRNTLLSMGFLKLQNSVWVYPYDCEDLIKLLKADFMIGKEILYIVADEIENIGWVKSYFNLAHNSSGR